MCFLCIPSHEVSSAGFWPDGGAIDYPAFYSYAYPAPEGFASASVGPRQAFFSNELGEYFLPYDAVRTAGDPRTVLLDFLQSTYEAAASRGKGQQDKFPKTPVFSHIEVADGRIWLRPDGTEDFCGDLPETEQKVVWATQSVPVPDLFNQKLDGVAWRSKPSWYIVGTKDRTVHPDLERAAAKRMGAKTIELDSSHVPMLSKPQAVLEVVLDAAKAAASRKG